MIGSNCARSSSLIEGCQRVHCLARNVFLLYINDLESNVPLYKYVDDSTLFEICDTTDR